jgi:hypothetical protein
MPAFDLIGASVTQSSPLEAAANDRTSAFCGQGTISTAEAGGLRIHADIILITATADRCERPPATVTTESTVHWLLNRQMSANRQPPAIFLNNGGIVGRPNQQR